MGLLAEKRHVYILDRLREQGRIHVSAVAGDLGVTEVTIRRDLGQLARSGLLKKTYGGAVLPGPPDANVSVRFRQTRNLAAKKRIGLLAAGLINDGDNIYFEAGSTCYEIIPHLTEHRDLTIIVNSLMLMTRLHELTGHRVIVTGGQYRPERMDMIGPTAEAAIAGLSGFTAFTGADDISIYAGISGADVATVSFTRRLLRQAAKVIFVGDRTKFDRPALYKIADIDQLDCIVTDADLSDKWHAAAKEHGIELIYPDE
ncbi:MAG: DeoR/GlpR transcriptional regulator [Planctomycetes bacterium]|nr:DeoR/GlpR transcriptional regulator [Planctomycetota bacterium]